MEGSWRGVAWVATVLASCVLVLGASGCGDDGDGGEATAAGAGDAPDAVQTDSPLRTFAPLIEVAADEPWRPMSGRWFIERSIFGFAEDQGCADRKIAVGHTLAEQRTDELNWIYPTGLGTSSEQGNYFRNPYDASCEILIGRTFYADQLTRPHDPGPRVEGLRRGEGYYLDLVDEQRGGLPPDEVASAPVYSERTDEGDDGVRLTYWLLFGMQGEPGAPGAREGDWERVDVLLHDAGDDSYEPLAVQTPLAETEWGAAQRIDGTHPVVNAARSTHAMTVAAPAAERCAGCIELRSWQLLAPAREQPWYGFGGAWGEPGETDATTGPLGPHGEFSTLADKELEPRG